MAGALFRGPSLAAFRGASRGESALSSEVDGVTYPRVCKPQTPAEAARRKWDDALMARMRDHGFMPCDWVTEQEDRERYASGRFRAWSV